MTNESNAKPATITTSQVAQIKIGKAVYATMSRAELNEMLKSRQAI